MSSQIGGKGSVRIKQRRKKPNSKKKLNEVQKGLKIQIEDINKKLLKLDDENYSKFQLFLDEILKEYHNDLKRIHINKSNGLKYSEINKMGSPFFYKNLLYPLNETKILIKTDCHEFIIKNFKAAGINLFIKFLDTISGIIKKREYDIHPESEIYNEEAFTKALNYFKISREEKVHFKDIREQYEIKISNNELSQEDKDIANAYYILLRNQYREYLKSTDE